MFRFEGQSARGELSYTQAGLVFLFMVHYVQINECLLLPFRDVNAGSPVIKIKARTLLMYISLSSFFFFFFFFFFFCFVYYSYSESLNINIVVSFEY